MPSFDNLLLVAAVAFVAPLALGLFPRVQLPGVVLEIVGGAERLRGQVLRLTAIAFALSFAVALAVSVGLEAIGLVDTPLLVAIILCATSLGVLIPVLKDTGEIASSFGQLIVAAATIADFGAIILLTVFFSGEGGTGATVVLLGALAALAVAVVTVVRAGRSMRLSDELSRLQDTTAQIRVRGAMALLVGFAAAAEALGLEVILGAFVAGLILTLVDRDHVMRHPDLRRKLDAVGFGFFIPVFFVTTGVRFDLGALTSSATSLAMVPVFLAALLAVRGLPALVYRRLLGPRRTLAAGVLQATSLPFIVAATAIGMDLGLVDPAAGAALIGAGLLSVLLFPLAGLVLLRGGTPQPAAAAVA